MTTLQGSLPQVQDEGVLGENPFADPARREAAEARPARTAPDLVIESPFGEEAALPEEDQFRTALSQTLHELQDESFDEALTELLWETEAVLEERFHGETVGVSTEMRQLAEAHLAPVGQAVDEYLDRFQAGLTDLDLEGLDDEALDELLDSFDPDLEGYTPAAEQFLGKVAKKAKKAARGAAKKAKKAARKAAGAAARAALAKLKRWARPLLERVLDMAINKLPVPLQAPARTLATSLLKREAPGATLEEESGFAPAMPTDPELLAASFDEVVAQEITAELFGNGQPAGLAEAGPGQAEAGAQLEQLVAARRELLTRIRQAGDEDDLGPAIEQFAPALLAALRLGIKLVGRKRVVGYLAGYVSRLIRRWVGPKMSGPLSTAIVDTGLRLMSLEQPEFGEELDEAGAMALAGTIEDTVRGVAELEEFVLEDENLMQLAVAEAFERAVAANFPPTLVRAGVQPAPRLGGFFVTRRAGTAHPYRRYSQAPEVDLSAPVAGAVRTFGGVPLAAELHARGVPLPQRYRVHVYEAVAGSSLRHLARSEHGAAEPGAGLAVVRGLHPLTPEAAGMLLQEPALGVAVPGRYLRSRSRIAAGQRFYSLEPLDSTVRLREEAAGSARPSSRRVTVEPGRGAVTARIYLSEEEAQQVAAAIRQGRGVPALLRTVVGTLRPEAQPELELEEEASGTSVPVAPALLAPLRRRVNGWMATALSGWAAQGAQEFARAAADPEDGVTVTVTLQGVPGLKLVQDARKGRLSPTALGGLLGQSSRARPTSTVSVQPGRAG